MLGHLFGWKVQFYLLEADIVLKASSKVENRKAAHVRLHPNFDQKSLKSLKIAIFTISVNFGVPWWWEQYLKSPNSSHSCQTVSQLHSKNCGDSLFARARREYVGNNWQLIVYFTKELITIGLKLVKVSLSMRRTVIQRQRRYQLWEMFHN